MTLNLFCREEMENHAEKIALKQCPKTVRGYFIGAVSGLN